MKHRLFCFCLLITTVGFFLLNPASFADAPKEKTTAANSEVVATIFLKHMRCDKAIEILKGTKSTLGLQLLGFANFVVGNYPEAVQAFTEAKKSPYVEDVFTENLDKLRYFSGISNLQIEHYQNAADDFKDNGEVDFALYEASKRLASSKPDKVDVENRLNNPRLTLSEKVLKQRNRPSQEFGPQVTLTDDEEVELAVMRALPNISCLKDCGPITESANKSLTAAWRQANDLHIKALNQENCGEFQAAKATLESAIKIYALDGSLYNDLALCDFTLINPAAKTLDLASIKDLLDKATKVSPDNWIIWRNSASISFLMGAGEEGDKAISQSLLYCPHGTERVLMKITAKTRKSLEQLKIMLKEQEREIMPENTKTQTDKEEDLNLWERFL